MDTDLHLIVVHRSHLADRSITAMMVVEVDLMHLPLPCHHSIIEMGTESEILEIESILVILVIDMTRHHLECRKTDPDMLIADLHHLQATVVVGMQIVGEILIVMMLPHPRRLTIVAMNRKELIIELERLALAGVAMLVLGEEGEGMRVVVVELEIDLGIEEIMMIIIVDLWKSLEGEVGVEVEVGVIRVGVELGVEVEVAEGDRVSLGEQDRGSPNWDDKLGVLFKEICIVLLEKESHASTLERDDLSSVVRRA